MEKDAALVASPSRWPPRFLASPLAREVLSGAAAGVTGTLIGFPLDTIKARLQTSHGAGVGALATALAILRTEGASAFFKGVPAPMISLVLLNVTSFAFYGETRRLLGLPERTRPHPLTLDSFAHVALAGALVAPPVTLLSTGFELVKVQCQVDNRRGVQLYRGAAHAAASIIRTHGVRTLFRGTTVNCAREAIFLGVYFSIYEHGREALGSSLGASAVPVAGGLAGVAGWAASFPLDALKSGVQSGDLNAPTPKARDVASRILSSSGGVSALYRGVGPTLVRAFLVSGSRFTAYEAVSSRLAAWAERGDLRAAAA